MTEKLVAIPKSEYEDLLQCKQRLEEMVQERIDQIESQIANMKCNLQQSDIITAIRSRDCSITKWNNNETTE